MSLAERESTPDAQAFCERVASGDWPRSMRHGSNGKFYDYDHVCVTWKDGSEHTYQIGSDNTGYGSDSALEKANKILTAMAIVGGREP